MTSLDPDSQIAVPLLRQAWCTVTFVHWRYPAAVVQPLLPAGLTVEEHGGSAWVSLIPLEMRDVRLPGMPPLPRLSTFPETNLRTYVRGPDNRSGIWFFSLDAASTWITVAARLLLGAPYFRADLAITAGDGPRYHGVRGGHAGYDLCVRPGQAFSPSGLDVWLTHRWRAYTEHAGWLLAIPVRHEPWPLRRAAVTRLDQSLTAAAGLPPPPQDALVHHSGGVGSVTFGPARPVRTPWRR